MTDRVLPERSDRPVWDGPERRHPPQHRRADDLHHEVDQRVNRIARVMWTGAVCMAAMLISGTIWVTTMSLSVSDLQRWRETQMVLNKERDDAWAGYRETKGRLEQAANNVAHEAADMRKSVGALQSQLSRIEIALSRLETRADDHPARWRSPVRGASSE